VQLVKGPVTETVATSKDQTSLAAELHLVPVLTTSAKGVKNLIGGVHLQKVAGDVVIKAPKIIVAGGVGKFNGGGSSINLNGGPVTLKGSKIAIEAGAIVKMGSSLKIG
jgi:type VI secretion system secreted protein VgrG